MKITPWNLFTVITTDIHGRVYLQNNTHEPVHGVILIKITDSCFEWSVWSEMWSCEAARGDGVRVSRCNRTDVTLLPLQCLETTSEDTNHPTSTNKTHNDIFLSRTGCHPALVLLILAHSCVNDVHFRCPLRLLHHKRETRSLHLQPK